MSKAMSKEAAVQFFACLFCGEHHIPPHGGPDGVKPFGEGWCVNTWENLATFDGNLLTELVFLAHDKAVRAEVKQGGPYKVKICIWQRAREGRLYDRHPTLEQAVAEWRKSNPLG